jgi:hypothetical protein
LAHEITGPHPGLAGEVLQGIDTARIQTNRHGALVRWPVELARGGPIAATRLVRSIAAACLVWAVAARLVRSIAGRPVALRKRPLATGTLT